MSHRCKRQKTAGRAKFFLADGETPENFREPTLYIAEIHMRAETMTPLLKEILDFRPRPHWEN
jgi:hypothetical protein